jgi:hypothetical protein
MTTAKAKDKAAADKLAKAKEQARKKAKDSRTDLLHVAAVLMAAGKDPDQAVSSACGLLEALDNHLEPEKEDADAKV